MCSKRNMEIKVKVGYIILNYTKYQKMCYAVVALIIIIITFIWQNRGGL